MKKNANPPDAGAKVPADPAAYRRHQPMHSTQWTGRRTVRWIAGVTATLALPACIAGSVQAAQDEHEATALTARMKTVCVGRFLVDVPVDAQVSLSRVVAGGREIASSDLESDHESAERLRQAEEGMRNPMNEDGRAPLFMRLAFTQLREGKRTLNGMQGEELVMRIREPNVTTGYAFGWETRGRQDDIHAPVRELELESGTNPVAGGKRVRSTLSGQAMFALWESSVASIRLRPTGPQPPPAGSPSSATASHRRIAP